MSAWSAPEKSEASKKFMGAGALHPVVYFYRGNSYFGTNFDFIASSSRYREVFFSAVNPKGVPREDSLALASLVCRPIKIEFKVSDKEENQRGLLSLRYSDGRILLRENSDFFKSG